MEKVNLTRRSILGIGWGAFLLSIFGTLVANVRFLFPNVLYEPPSRVKLGRPEDYAIGSSAFVPEQRVYLLREREGFRCISAVCTHLRCTINNFDPPDAEFPEPHSHCPCHGSVFAKKDGRVLRPPAPRPLEMYHVALAPDGRLLVDTGRRVAAEFVLRT
ncbi:MAG: ubiquinol-cytochrome c reductase iron-sulfur subunit [Nitrospinota bacterium]